MSVTPEVLLQKVAANWVQRLKSFGLWPQFLREIIVDHFIASIECTAEENESAWAEFCANGQIDPVEANGAILQRFGLNEEELKAACARQARVAKFKKETWGKALPAYFLKRKTSLDRVVYSILRLRDAALARELYLRIKEGEQTFAEIAAQYSEGPEARTSGIIGPIALGAVHPSLRPLLAASAPGKLRAPVHIGEWHVVTRVEKLWAAELNSAIEAQLLQELFEASLNAEMKRQFEKLGP